MFSAALARTSPYELLAPIPVPGGKLKHLNAPVASWAQPTGGTSMMWHAQPPENFTMVMITLPQPALEVGEDPDGQDSHLNCDVHYAADAAGQTGSS